MTIALLLLAWSTGRVDGRDAGVTKAREFVLVDARGATRARWFVDEEGAATLSIRDTRSNPILTVSVEPHGHARVALLDPSGNDRLVLGLDNHGPSLRMGPSDESVAIELACGSETGSKKADSLLLRLDDGRGVSQELGFKPGQSTFHSLMSGKKRRISLTVDRKKVPRVEVADGRSTGELVPK